MDAEPKVKTEENVVETLQSTLARVLAHRDSGKISAQELDSLAACMETAILQDISVQALIRSKLGVLVKQFYDFVHSEPSLKELDLISRCAFRKLKKRACETLFGIIRSPEVVTAPEVKREEDTKSQEEEKRSALAPAPEVARTIPARPAARYSFRDRQKVDRRLIRARKLAERRRYPFRHLRSKSTKAKKRKNTHVKRKRAVSLPAQNRVAQVRETVRLNKIDKAPVNRRLMQRVRADLEQVLAQVHTSHDKTP